MKKLNIIRAAALVAAAFIATSCSKEGETGEVAVSKIDFANSQIVDGTMNLKAGEAVKLAIETTPSGGEVTVQLTGTNFGRRVLSYDHQNGTLTALCGGQGQVVAVAANGDKFTTAKFTVKVDEPLKSIGGDPNRNLFWLWRRTDSDIRRVNVWDMVAPLDPITSTAPITVSNVNTTDFTLAADGKYYYNAVNGTIPSPAAEMKQDKVTVSAKNPDGSTHHRNLYFRNAASLGMSFCCASYQNYGYYPGGLVDATETGGWHSNNRHHLAEDATPTHYLLVDFKEDFTMTGVELWRGTGDTRTAEIWYAPSSVEVKMSSYSPASTDALRVWRNQIMDGGTRLGEIDFADAGDVKRKGVKSAQPFKARYIMVRVTASNRGVNCNLTEIYPYIVLPD